MSRLKKVWSISWRIGFCLLLLLWIFHSIFMTQGKVDAEARHVDWSQLDRQAQWKIAWTRGPEDLWSMLRLVQPGTLIGSFLLAGGAIFLCVLRWRIVLEALGLHLPLGRATRISFVGQFFNSFLLGSTGGDLIKAYYAARETHHKKTEAVTTVFVDRIVGLWAMLLFAGIMMIPNYKIVLADRHIGIPCLFILAMLGGVTVLLWLAFWGGVTKRVPRARALLRKIPKGELLERAIDSCRNFGTQQHFLLKTVAISLLTNFMFVLQMILLASGLNLNVTYLPIFVIVPVIFCISAIPITPNGLGVRENLYVVMLAAIGASRTGALSVSLIASAQGLFWSLIGGVIYMASRQKDHLTEVTGENAGANEIE